MSLNRKPHPEDVKAALRKQGSSLAQIARELGVSIQAVSAVLYGKVTSERIEDALARAISSDSNRRGFVRLPDGQAKPEQSTADPKQPPP